MIDRQKLLSDLQALLRTVEADLLARSEDAELPEVSGWLKAEYESAKEAGRTAQTLKSWVDDFVTQVAAAWVLSCVFVRYLEDNTLVDPPRIAGPASDAGGGQSRLKRARDEYDHWVQNNRGQTDREYLLDIFQGLAALPAAGEVFGPHNPLNALPNWLSGDAARAMLAFFQKVDSDTGEITHDFTDASGDTRFLGDLYQDLSEAARKKYALLQTPDFVEEFILDRTLEPALDEFGLQPCEPTALAAGSARSTPAASAVGSFKLIDPACGSGHFLLGAFPRILDRWLKKEPGEKIRVLVQRALDSIHGVDVNPYAIAIARFRLLLAALAAEGVKKLKDAPAYRIHLACGDSLWHAPLRGDTGSASRGQNELPAFAPEADSESQQHTYFAEDAARLREILAEGQYHCVVANPPYIVPKDRALNQDYRARYASCHMKYSLAVPFMERIFRLAIALQNEPGSPLPASGRGAGGEGLSRAGFTGQITANSFMKREFGKKLIEEYLPTIDLTHVIDTSGAYIPGHGTPTTILFGRHRPPIAPTIRTVMGIKGEPSTPDDPSKGLVWTAIVDQIDQPGSESDFVSAGDSERERFGSHPWSIGGGGAAELKELLEESCAQSLKELASEVGILGMTNADDVMLGPSDNFRRHCVESSMYRSLVMGDEVRDWTIAVSDASVFPYVDGELASIEAVSGLAKFFWANRTVLGSRVTFGRQTYFQEGRPWWAWHQLTAHRLKTPLTIIYADIATHNHFVLERGGKVFNRTAPLIKLPAEIECDDGSRRPVTEDDHLALLGLLNSSTACFWMRQVSNCKGLGGQGGGIKPEAWHRAYAFNATNLSKLPIPNGIDRCVPLTREVVKVVGLISDVRPANVLSKSSRDLAARLNAAKSDVAQYYRKLTALQEELDWLVYDLYGLTDYEATPTTGTEYGFHPEDRPCEVLLKETIADGFKSIFYDVHRYRGADRQGDVHETTESMISQRLKIIAKCSEVRLIETPDYKRRWQFTSWESQVERALESWLLDRLESYFDLDGRMNDEGTPTAKVDNELVSIARLADIAAADEAFMEVAAVYRDDPAFNVPKLVEDLVKAENVPLLPILRYKPAGIRKREQWEETWALQRKEDWIDGLVGKEVQGEDLLFIINHLSSVIGEDGNPLLPPEMTNDKCQTINNKSLLFTREHATALKKETIGDIPVPPKYKSSDFISTGGARYWALRGKLDVPKERWISFPHCPGTDGTLMICWAGYDHLQQALAIAGHYQTIKEDEGGVEDPRLIPLLACIAELLPWLKQWHSEIDSTYGMSMSDYFDGFLTEEARALNQTIEEIKAWRPPATTTRRRKTKS
jgi:hypothetical protein